MKIKNRIELGVNSAKQILKHNTYLLWFLILWLFRLPLEVAACIHWSQGYRTPSCLFSTCFFKWPAEKAVCSHWSQGCPSPSCLYFLCLFRSVVVVAAYLHWSQGYLTPSCLFSICFFKWLYVVATYSHWAQGYLTPICLIIICFFRWPAWCSEKRICLDINASSEKFNSNYRKWISLKNFKI